ncbi:hypothetical protein [Sorangium sp. So ce1151]|uniref:hypothetical protein n=1 Tax=Sorangium sp. So ce1151 TaxID=3133332 RepID=UPI003F5E12F4
MEDEQGSGQGGALAEALAGWVGARIDAAHANPATGLVALAVYAGARRVLGAGVGPRVAGAGVLPRLPRLRAGASHPLVAAMRAHLACGGSVVVDGMPDGSGGAGATSASSVDVGVTSTSSVGFGVTSTATSSTNTSSVTSSATGVGGGGAWSLCVSYCELLQNGMEVAGCQLRGPACDVALGCCRDTFDKFRSGARAAFAMEHDALAVYAGARRVASPPS